MQTENWKKVKEILAEVLALEFSRRQNYLEKAEISDEIRQEVESLLAVETEAASLMNLSAVEFSKDFFDEGEDALIGQQVGIYRIVRELGYGGMGAVYLGTRNDGKFEQKVAIKMLRREYNIGKIRRNFEREKEILATLVHPNIATLIDAGTTADGVPFLVMEYIEGVPVDKFCQNRKLTLMERLKLFNRVCLTVGFAHRNLVIHRDLKPSNILVTADGEPKLLDFGISKLLDAEIEQTNTITNLGAMTPEYASPEQMRGESVTTATDIYSLGVVLFKILTGNLPFNVNGKTNGELLKIISEDAPSSPSDTFQEREKGRKGEREKRNLSSNISSSPHLPFSPSQLKGDIDNIILKSLCKEPERRYQTVEQFSADIWRFIDGLPVLARPATFSYRASKFYGRNKVAVIAGIVVFLALVMGIAVAFWQARVAREQAWMAIESQRKSEIETEHAKTEKEKAEKITAYMSKVFSYANPRWYAEGAKFKGETKVIEVMDELSDKIDTEFAGQADIQAELHHKFAEIFNSVAGVGINKQSKQYKVKALDHIRRALELRKQFYGERHELVAKDMVYLYWCGGVEEEDWATYLMEAINMMRETNPHNLNLPYMLEAYSGRIMLPDTPQTHEAYRNAVIPPTVENKYEIGERYIREALPIFREHYKEDNYAIFGNECRLAYALAIQEKWTDFDEHYAVCKQGETKLQDTDIAKGMRTNVELVEQVLVEKDRLRIGEKQ